MKHIITAKEALPLLRTGEKKEIAKRNKGWRDVFEVLGAGKGTVEVMSHSCVLVSQFVLPKQVLETETEH